MEVKMPDDMYERVLWVAERINDRMNEVIDALSREWEEFEETMRQYASSCNEDDEEPSLRPDRKCYVKIDTKGHNRAPSRVARSMRRVGRK